MYKEIYGKSLSGGTMELARRGLIQIDRLYEEFEAKIHGCSVEHSSGCDLSNGMECKIRTTRLHRPNQYKVFLEKTATKIKSGPIILGIVNTGSNQFDRLCLPQTAGYVPGNSLSIYWNPKKGSYGKYHDFLISSNQL